MKKMVKTRVFFTKQLQKSPDSYASLYVNKYIQSDARLNEA